MNGWLLAAASLCLVGFVGHILHGERRYIPAIQSSGLVVEQNAWYTAMTLRGAWHVWAFAYALSSALLAIYAFLPLDAGARIAAWGIVAMFAATTIMLLYFSRGKLPAVHLQTTIVLLVTIGLIF